MVVLAISSRLNTRNRLPRRNDMAKEKSNLPGSPKAPDFKNEPEQPPAPLPPLKASPLPQVEKKAEAETGRDACAIPCDDEFTDGIFVNKADGEDYALCIHVADGYGRTHSCKNSQHTWQGTEDEFDATFKKA